MKRILLFLLCLLPLAALGNTPLDTLKEAQKDAEKLLSTSPKPGSAAATKRKADLEKEARALFDFEELAKRALGKHWSTGTAAQQTELVTLFSGPIVDNYLTQLEGRTSKGFTLTWGDETINGTEATVESNVKGKTTSGKTVDIKVKYFMIQKGTSWVVYDVVTDESSILDVQKESFKKAFKTEKTFENVLNRLRKKSSTSP
jgi:phospholipid transport system substrate-binding protein